MISGSASVAIHVVVTVVVGTIHVVIVVIVTIHVVLIIQVVEVMRVDANWMERGLGVSIAMCFPSSS